jgi:hypothetical protein
MEPPNNDMPKLINFLTQNGYLLEQVQYNPDRGASARAIFEKQAPITELNGNYVNDTTIRLSVDFDKTIDYRNGVDDEEEGMIYNYSQARGLQFITELINGTYDNPGPIVPVVVPVPQGAPSNGGKIKTKRRTRKTRKNRKR